MKKDKLVVYLLETILLMILFFALFMPTIFTRLCLAIILILYLIFTNVYIKKKNIVSIYKRDVSKVLLIFGLIYVMFFYTTGIFVGYYKTYISLNLETIFKDIIPIVFIVITSEKLRNIFLSQDKVKLSKFFVTMSMILLDMSIYINIYSINNRETFANIIGYSLFASISCNLLYNYISYRHGSEGIIIYRLITMLYSYIIPIVPDVYVFFRAVFRIIYPYIIYLVLDYSFKKRSRAMEYIDNKKRILSFGITTVVIILIVMLISCNFKYGVLVIGSGSMRGTLEVGDAVIFESYNSKKANVGDIIVFNKNDVKYVHRIINVSFTNGEYRYYTKGDANQVIDDGYVVNKDIVGIFKFRVRYLGYPSILLRDMFE